MNMKSLKHQDSSLWQAQITILVAVVLQILLGNQLSLGSKYVIAGLGVALLLVHEFVRSTGSRDLRRLVSICLIGLISFANFVSLVLVSDKLLFDGKGLDGHKLILSAFLIFITNIIIFGLWYWEMATTGLGGTREDDAIDDFLFPQENMHSEIEKGKKWQATFFDYLYVSVTNATAFSPTDVLPLTHRAKLLMALQSLTSLVTIALLAARAVNILA